MAEQSIEELIQQTEEFLKQSKESELRSFLQNLHPEDLATLIDHLEESEKTKVFTLLNDDMAADVLIKLDDESRDLIEAALSAEEISQLVATLEPDEAVDVIAELSDEEQTRVMALLPEEEAAKISELLPYAPETAGGLMNPNFMAVEKDATAGDVLEQVSTAFPTPSASNLVYVTDSQSRLVGLVSLRMLIMAEKAEKIEEVMNRRVVSVSVHDDQEEVVNVVSKYDLTAVPVVDERNVLKGVVTADDVMDVMEEEATEDMMRMAGTDVTESTFTSPPRAAVRRLPWLYLNLATAFVAASIVGFFRESISSVVALAIFMPIIAAMGGNAGAQTLAVVVRSIALGEVTVGDVKRVLQKEMFVGILTGVGVGAISSVVAYVWNHSLLFGLLVGVSLIINLFMACAVGALIPLLLKRLRVDPALASTVFLITLTDSIGFFVFLGLATLFLERLQLV